MYITYIHLFPPSTDTTPHSTIFKADGTQVDPRSKEGKIIVDIYAEQKAVRELNRDEKLKWILTTFPRDPVKQQEYRTKFGV